METAVCNRCDKTETWDPDIDDPSLPVNWSECHNYFGLTMLSGPKAGKYGIGVEVFNLCPECSDRAFDAPEEATTDSPSWTGTNPDEDHDPSQGYGLHYQPGDSTGCASSGTTSMSSADAEQESSA